jgi:hypothetical protein
VEATDDAADIPNALPFAMSAPVPQRDNGFLSFFEFDPTVPFSDGVITSSAFSLGDNNSEVAACSLFTQPTTTSALEDAAGSWQPADTPTPPPGPKLIVAGSADRASDPNSHQAIVVANELPGVFINKIPEGPWPNHRILQFEIVVHNLSGSPVDSLTVVDQFPAFTAFWPDILFDSERGGRSALPNSEFPNGTEQRRASNLFSLAAHQEKIFTIACITGLDDVTNSASLMQGSVTLSLDTATQHVNAPPVPQATLDTAAKIANQVQVAITLPGSKLLTASRISASASGAVILVDGMPKKTVPDAILPNQVLIAPKGGKKIKPGQTVTLQVQFADGTTTNTITYTEPAG